MSTALSSDPDPTPLRRGRLVFLGSPPAAVPTLEALVHAGHEIALVVSQPDRRRGRGSALTPSPVKEAARGLGLAVTDQLEDVVGAGAELGVVVAYGRIIPQRILDALPMINVHFSLLPRWRGAAPVERAILAGDDRTGVCIMRLEAGLDTGPVLGCSEVAIGADESAPELMDRLAHLGAALTLELLAPGPDALAAGDAQQGEPTYAAKIDPAELRIDWRMPAVDLARLVRLGRAWTTFRGERLRALRAAVVGTPPATGAPATGPPATGAPATGAPATGPPATGEPETGGPETGGPETGGHRPGAIEDDVVVTGDGRIRLLELQPAGRRPQAAAEWMRGVRPTPDDRLGHDGAASGSQ